MRSINLKFWTLSHNHSRFILDLSTAFGFQKIDGTNDIFATSKALYVIALPFEDIFSQMKQDFSIDLVWLENRGKIFIHFLQQSAFLYPSLHITLCPSFDCWVRC